MLSLVIFSYSQPTITGYIKGNETSLDLNIPDNIINYTSGNSSNITLVIQDHEDYFYQKEIENYTFGEKLNFSHYIKNATFNYTIENKTHKAEGINLMWNFTDDNYSLLYNHTYNVTHNGTHEKGSFGLKENKSSHDSIFISPKRNKTYPASEPLQIVANISESERAIAAIKKRESSFMHKLEYNEGLYESGFFRLLDTGLFNVTLRIYNDSGSVSEFETHFYYLDEHLKTDKSKEKNQTIPLDKNESKDRTLNEEDANITKLSQSDSHEYAKKDEDNEFLKIISPEEKNYGMGKKIQFAVRVKNLTVYNSKAVVNWRGGKVTQELYNFDDENLYETGFFNALSPGRYSVNFIFDTDKGVKNVSRYFSIARRPNQFYEKITIKSKGREISKKAIIEDYSDSPFGNRAMERLTMKNVTNVITSIEFNNITTGPDLDIRIDDLVREDFTQSYAIDPENLNFTNATVNVTAQGTELYKCEDWDYDSQECYGEWEIFKTGLIPGETYSFELTPDDPGFGEVRIDNCVAQSLASSSGTWTSSCDHPYPGPALFSENEGVEVHQVEKQGNNIYWAGIKVNSINTSVNDCAEIEQVEFCYKWWSETDRIASCDISVSSDGEESYTAITNECPQVGEPPGITCVDITELESWDCDTFYDSSSPGAYAKSEITSSGGGANAIYDITWDVFYFNVTYIDTPPQWSDANSDIIPEYDSYEKSRFNISWIDNVAVDTVYFESNYTGSPENYTMENLTEIDPGSVFSYEAILPAGDHYWRSHANDTGDNWETSDTWYFTIEKADPELTLTADPGWNITYGIQKNISCTASTSQVTPMLYRNNTHVGSYDISNLSAGKYNYVCSNAETQNYTSSSVSQNLTINKSPGDIRLYLNGTRTNRIIENESTLNITSVLNNGKGNISVSVNETIIHDGEPPSENIFFFDSVDIYEITATYGGNENYTFDSESWLVNVTPGPPPDFPPEWSENSSSIITPYEEKKSDFQITWQDDDEVDTVFFETNKSGFPQNFTMDYIGSNIYNFSDYFAAGDYYWRSYANDSSGNWSVSDTWHFTIERADPGLSLTASPSWDVTYGNETNVSCISSTDQVNATLYRDSTKIPGGYDLANLDAGTYNYTCNSTQVQNYTYSSVYNIMDVDKAESDVWLYLDGQRNNIVVENNTFVDIDALLPEGEGNIVISRNDTIIYNGSAPYSEKLLFNEINVYNISLEYQGNKNYYASSESWLVNVVPIQPVSKMLTIQDCIAQDAAEESDTFQSSCDFQYPGPYLFYDNDAIETHQVRTQGGRLYWAGLMTESSNSSIDNCVRVESVNVCYLWWSETTNVDSCYIAVSADGESDYSEITNECPGTQRPSEITCVDVTPIHDWDCDSFFGESSQAMIKSEIRSSGGENVYSDIYWNVFHFNIDYVKDDTPPSVNIRDPESIIYLQNQEIEISALIYDDNNVDYAYANVSWNNSNEKIELSEMNNSIYSGVFTNTSYIGQYNVTFFANDTFDNINDTETISFWIEKSPYHLFYGNASSNIKLGKEQMVLFDYGPAEIKNMYFADIDSDYSFSDLQAIGRKVDGTPSTGDFSKLDEVFSMENYSTSFTRKWASDDSSPKNTETFNIYGMEVENVPVINSTESGNFVTGILWDTGGSDTDEFSVNERQDIVFITRYTPQTQGLHGIYGFEALIPGNLGNYTGFNNRVSVLQEI